MKPGYEPKTEKQKLGYLVEECGEVLAAAGKTLRWGLGSYNPELPRHERETNAEWLRRELADLRRAIVYVEEMLDDVSPRSATIDLRCPGCDRRAASIPREPYDPTDAVVAEILCPECASGMKDPPTVYRDPDGREVFPVNNPVD